MFNPGESRIILDVPGKEKMGNVTLSPERVDVIFRDCLFQENEDTSDRVVAEGIMRQVGFHPGRLRGHEQEIKDLLDELPDSFMVASGGGMSFLEACLDKRGNLWTGEHRIMEQLFLLGIAVGKAEYCAPREMWPAFPSGMPYIVIK